MAMIGPLEEGRWRWTKLREERVSDILSAIEREGLAKSRHTDIVKSFSSYLIVARRCGGGSGVAWTEWEDSSNGFSRLPNSDSAEVPNALALVDALGPVFDLVNSIKEPRADCPLFEGEVFRKRTLADYSNLWALNESLHLDG